MIHTPLRQSRALAANLAPHLYEPQQDRDIIMRVLHHIMAHHPRLYRTVIDAHGRMTAHAVMAKAVKKALGASNGPRKSSSPDAPCKTHRQLDQR